MSKLDLVADAVRALLPSHRASGQPLPSIRALSRTLGVSIITARGAYERLTREGLVLSRHGAGFFAATSTRPKSSRLVALLLGSTDEPLFAGIARGADAVCRLAGYRLALALTDYRHGEEQRQLRALATEAAGVIAIPLPPGSTPGEITPVEAWRVLDEAGVPTVFIDSRPQLCDSPLVALDNRAAGALVAGHLLDAEPAGLIVIMGQRTESAEERIAGAKTAAADRGAAVEVIRSTYHSEHAGEDGLLAYLARTNRRLPVAVMACSDRIALGCCRAARRAGFTVGREVLVAGFDDLPLAAAADPPLTSVQQDAELLGRQAATQMLALLRSEKPPPQPRLPPRLTIRASTGSRTATTMEAV